METVSGEEVKELGHNNLDQIVSSLSGVFVNTASDGMRVSIRGMSDDGVPSGSLGVMNTSSAMVAVNTDGVYNASGSGTGLYDLERVEVLYGPQSTLYSSNSPGGIVNIVTADPKIDAYEVSASFKYGNYKTMQMDGMLNAPVTDTLAVRVAFSTSAHDGYMANGADDDDTKSARVKALYKPLENLSFMFAGEVSKTDGYGFSGTSAFVDESDLDDPWDNSEMTGPSPRRRDSFKPKVYGRVDWDFGFGALTLIPMYSPQEFENSQTSEDMMTGYETVQTLDTEKTEKGAELRIASGADAPFEWIFGLNWYESDQYQDFDWYYESLDVSLKKNRGNWQKTKAVYGNITYPLSDSFRVTGGIRYSDDENTTQQYAQELSLGTDAVTGDTIVTGILLREKENTATYSSPDYKIGVEYDLSEKSMVYADVSTSYRTTGANLTSTSSDPEELLAYTLGVKNRFFENRLQLNASAFYYDYKNYMAEGGNIIDPLTFQNDDGSNASGKLTKYGVDVQTTTILGMNDKIDFSVSYLDSEFDELYFDFVSEALPDFDASGKPLTYSSEWSLNLAYSHDFDLPNGGSLTARIDTSYKSSYYLSYKDWEQDRDTFALYTIEENVNYQEAYHLSNCSLVYKHPDGKWTFTGYVNNIEDYAVKKSLMMGNMIIGNPRTVGAMLSIRY
jgi:iron complex outermembrane receptor protein